MNAPCFSDGVGIITSHGMRLAMQQYRAYQRTGMSLPSALQVRIGGAKGMLTLWDGMCDFPSFCRVVPHGETHL